MPAAAWRHADATGRADGAAPAPHRGRRRGHRALRRPGRDLRRALRRRAHLGLHAAARRPRGAAVAGAVARGPDALPAGHHADDGAHPRRPRRRLRRGGLLRHGRGPPEGRGQGRPPPGDDQVRPAQPRLRQPRRGRQGALPRPGRGGARGDPRRVWTAGVRRVGHAAGRGAHRAPDRARRRRRPRVVQRPRRPRRRHPRVLPHRACAARQGLDRAPGERRVPRALPPAGRRFLAQHGRLRLLAHRRLALPRPRRALAAAPLHGAAARQRRARGTVLPRARRPAGAAHRLLRRVLAGARPQRRLRARPRPRAPHRGLARRSADAS